MLQEKNDVACQLFMHIITWRISIFPVSCYLSIHKGIGSEYSNEAANDHGPYINALFLEPGENYDICVDHLP